MVLSVPFDLHTLLTYCAAAAALVVAPGPAQALVITRSIQGGTRGGLLTSVGLEIGTIIHTVAAAIGLSAILASSATAFLVVKYAGAAYLIVLGFLMLRRSAGVTKADGQQEPPAVNGGRLVLHAAMTGVLNPKVAVFFLAFLPQFVDPRRGAVLLQFLILGMILGTLGLICDSTIAVIAGRVRHRLDASGRFAAWRERVTGTVLVALGLRLAMADRS